MQLLSARLGLSGNNPVAEVCRPIRKCSHSRRSARSRSPNSCCNGVGFGRLDWQAAERHRFTMEGIGAYWNSPGGGLTRVSETFGTTALARARPAKQWLLGRWEAFLTPNLLAVTQASVGRTIQTAHAETPSAFEQTLLNQNVWGQLPQIVVDSRYGFTIGNPSRFGPGSYPDEHLFELQESVDWVRGSLLVKAGIDSATTPTPPACFATRPAPTPTPASPTSSPMRLSLPLWDSGRTRQVQPAQLRPDRKGWRDSGGNLRGLGYLPCYSYYSQTMGPTNGA